MTTRGAVTTYAFLLHPRDRKDVDCYRRRIPAAEAERILRTWSPLVCAHLGPLPGLGKAVGTVVAAPLTTAQFLGLPRAFVRAKVLQAAEYAIENGAELIGLGAMTSVVTRGGGWLADRLKIPVTSGNAFTAAVVARTLEADWGKGLASRCVAVVGATGSVGQCVAALIAPWCARLLLVARQFQALEPFAARLRAWTEVALTSDPAAARYANIVVLATASARPVLSAKELRRDAVLYDLTEPSNLLESALGAHALNGVDRRRCGLVRIPGLCQDLDPALPPDVFYACLAETVLMAVDEKVRTTSVGPADVTLARALGEAGERWGFRPITLYERETIRRRNR